jgi:hypothetical protein
MPHLAWKGPLKVLAYSIDRLGRRMMIAHTRLLLYRATQHVASALIGLAPGHLSLEKNQPWPVTVVVHIENVIAERERHLFIKRQDGFSRKLKRSIYRGL